MSYRVCVSNTMPPAAKAKPSGSKSFASSKGRKKSKQPSVLAGIDKNRKYDAYFGSMAKSMQMSTTGEVNHEMDKMLRYVLSELSSTSNSVLSHYAKKSQTVRPNVAYAAFTCMLNGELRTEVTGAGAAALVEFVNKSKQKKAPTPDGDDEN